MAIKTNWYKEAVVYQIYPLSFMDSNNDGINDYYTKLLKEGKLRLSNGSNELMGIDLNYNEDNQDPDKQDRVMSDDYDGDGIKNGDEIEIIPTAKYNSKNVSEAEKIMRQYNIHSLIVVNEANEFVGIIDAFSCM